MNDDVEDSLKSLAQIYEPDERQKMFVGTLRDRHRMLSDIKLNDSVPRDVRQLFETAKNASLYLWFVYRFNQVAEMVGFTSLEAALLKKCEIEKVGDYAKRSPGLKRLLNIAVKKEWLTEEGFDDRYNIARMRVEFRNEIKSMDAGVVEIPEPAEQEIIKEMKEMRLLPGMCEAGPKLRNDLVHGRVYLSLHSISTLNATAQLINQLF
jgi:hypothetical protein